jgi:tetratricopeptide (TPR) repeat protein
LNVVSDHDLPTSIKDMGAKQLVERLAGLPLALATAGAFLRRRRCSFEQYLQKYEEWNVDPRRSVPLEEYQGQKLWTTWDISYDQLKKEDKDAAQMLKLLAYFGNQKIWYGYLCAGLTEDSPLHDVIADEFSFDGVMEVLTGYNFLEYHPKFEVWSMHNCIHDWTLATLNKDISSQFFWYAFECAARSIRETYGSECMSWFYHSDTFNTPPFACIVPHAVRLCQPRFIKDDVFSISSPNQLEFIVDVYGLLDDQFELITEGILLLALPHCQRIFGPTHEFTLNLMSTIGWSYRRQGCFDKACKFLLRAVTKLEETLGLYNTSTLSTIVNLSVVYISQGNLSGATDILSRTIAETRSAASEVPEEEWSCRSKLLEIHTNLALAYMKQGNELEAESILKHVIDKREKTQGKTHMSTLVVHMNLGAIYQDQGKSENSERIFRHILDSTRKFLSPDHPFVLSCTFNLGEALYDQGKIEEAQKLFHDALCGYEKTIGGYDERTLKTAYRIGKISEKQGDIDNAERMYERALAGFERSLGPEHEVTIDVLKCLGILYLEKHQMKNAEDMLHRSLRGSKKGGSVRGASILALAIGARYLKTAQLDKAERMHLIALEGFQKDTDANDSEVGAAAMGLWVIYLMKGDRIQAERMRNLAEPVMSQVSNSPGKS